jgi:hypothetical protein
VNALAVAPALDQTLLALQARPWELVLLGAQTKKPSGAHWDVTTYPVRLTTWIAEHGRNVGNVCHERTRLMVLDPDKPDLWREMTDELGEPGRPWVRTGSGKFHYYFEWHPRMPAKLTWRGQILGEIQRGNTTPGLLDGQQQVVLPPSTHPNGMRYEWLVDPVTEPLMALPPLWQAYLYEPEDDEPRRREPSPDVQRYLAAALRQPGAKRRGSGVKFQCSGCRAEGHDRHHDNAVVWASGRWGCAVGGRAHNAAIARQLGVTVDRPPSTPDAVPDVGYLEPVARFIAEDDPPQTYIIPELVPAGAMTLIHGIARARKSLAAFELALSAATGTAAFGLKRFTPSDKIVCLYIQEEVNLPRFGGHPRSHGSAVGVCHGQTQAASIHDGVQGAGRSDCPGER